MKKLFSSFIALVLGVISCFSLIGCGEKEPPEPDEPTSMTYSGVLSSSAALEELAQGADIAVVDGAYANYYINALGHSELVILTGEDFTFADEQIVAACKKGSNIDEYITAALYEMQQNKQKIELNNKDDVEYNLADIADHFGMSSRLITISEPTVKFDTAPESGSDWAKLNQLKVGFTADGNATGNIQILPFVEVGHYGGYDGIHSLIAKSICSVYKFGGSNPYTFENVKWDERKSVIEDGTFDVLFGNFTKESLGENDFDFTVPFFTNSTVIVVKTTDKDKFTSYESMKSAKFVSVTDSKAEALLKGDINSKIFG